MTVSVTFLREPSAAIIAGEELLSFVNANMVNHV